MQENEAKTKAQNEEQQQAENRFLELQRKAKEQQDKYAFLPAGNRTIAVSQRAEQHV